MSDDDVDYMSEEFLAACVAGSNDVRPGLMHSHSTKRKMELDKKKAERNESHRKKMRPIKEIQEERLREGMNTAIDTSNKGFAMLQKMGFKPGMSLGKEAEKGKGRIEPVGVELKSDRVGFGWQELIARKRKAMEELRKQMQEQRKEEFDPIKYRERMSNQHSYQRTVADLHKSQRTCHRLDRDQGILDPPIYWFWPESAQPQYEEDEYEGEDGATNNQADNDYEDYYDENDDETFNSKEYYEENDVFEPTDQLEILTSYLRDTYWYCMWCCTSYDSYEDMESHCPGTTRGDHSC